MRELVGRGREAAKLEAAPVEGKRLIVCADVPAALVPPHPHLAARARPLLTVGGLPVYSRCPSESSEVRLLPRRKPEQVHVTQALRLPGEERTRKAREEVTRGGQHGRRGRGQAIPPLSGAQELHGVVGKVFLLPRVGRVNLQPGPLRRSTGWGRVRGEKWMRWRHTQNAHRSQEGVRG